MAFKQSSFSVASAASLRRVSAEAEPNLTQRSGSGPVTSGGGSANLRRDTANSQARRQTSDASEASPLRRATPPRPPSGSPSRLPRPSTPLSHTPSNVDSSAAAEALGSSPAKWGSPAAALTPGSASRRPSAGSMPSHGATLTHSLLSAASTPYRPRREPSVGQVCSSCEFARVFMLRQALRMGIDVSPKLCRMERRPSTGVSVTCGPGGTAHGISSSTILSRLHKLSDCRPCVLPPNTC